METVLRALEEGGVAQLVRDGSGSITGIALKLEAKGFAASSGSAELGIQRGLEAKGLAASSGSADVGLPTLGHPPPGPTEGH